MSNTKSSRFRVMIIENKDRFQYLIRKPAPIERQVGRHVLTVASIDQGQHRQEEYERTEVVILLAKNSKKLTSFRRQYLH